MIDLNTNLWWGYRHTNGSLQIKRYFGSLDILEARESPFCEVVVNPFPATDRDDAIHQLKIRLGEPENSPESPEP